MLTQMERWLPDDLVEHIHRVNVLENHKYVMADLVSSVSHSCIGFEEAWNDHFSERAETYELLVESPTVTGGKSKRVIYTNRPIDHKGLWRSVLHVFSSVEAADGIFAEQREHMLLDSPIDNKVAVYLQCHSIPLCS